ncbi:MAG: DUF262 domain-containing protein, partial [Sphingobacteriales bacterium]
QRLITLTLLANAIYHEAMKRDRSALADRILADFIRAIDYDSDETDPRVRLSDVRDNETFQEILTTGRAPIIHDKDSVSARMAESYNLLLKRLREDLAQDPFKRLGKWTKFLTDRLYFAVFLHPDSSSAYQVYEVINTRGKELTTADLLKNYVLSQTPEGRRDDCYTEWQSIQRRFADEGSNNFVQYIRHAVTIKAGHVLPKDLFDFIIIKPAKYSYVDKLLIRYTPFKKTVFLDTDTLIINPLDDLFALLHVREFAVFQQDEGYEYQMPENSGAMPEFNTGVIAFVLTPAVQKLFGQWEKSFEEFPAIKTDQFHLRRYLYESDVRYSTFSSAYNFIVSYNNYVIQHVKVLHGRPHSYLQLVAKRINDVKHESAWRRTYYPVSNRFFVLYSNPTIKDSFFIFKQAAMMLMGNIARYPKRKLRKHRVV